MRCRFRAARDEGNVLPHGAESAGIDGPGRVPDSSAEQRASQCEASTEGEGSDDGGR